MAVLHEQRYLLGFKRSEPLDALADSDVAKLVYRDNISIKHAGRNRLSHEVQSLANSTDTVSLYGKRNQNPMDKLTALGGPLSKALTAYLLEVSKRDVSLIFAVNKSLVGHHLHMVEASYPSQVKQSGHAIKFSFVFLFCRYSITKMLMQLQCRNSPIPTLEDLACFFSFFYPR